MKYNIKNIVFDFDGTLADTKESIIFTIRETLRKRGIDKFNKVKVQEMIGLPLENTLQEMGINKIEEAIKDYRIMYDEIALQKVTLFPGVVKTLYYLKNKKIKMAIASSKGRAALNNLLTHLKIADFFEYIAGEQDVKTKKPDPGVVNYLLKKMKANTEETIVVGDTEYDILMGKSARCLTCAVTYGNHTRSMLACAAPDFIVDNIMDLQKIFR